MTERLEKAVSAASALPDDAQDEVAELILAEIESQTAWRDRFSPKFFMRMSASICFFKRIKQRRGVDSDYMGRFSSSSSRALFCSAVGTLSCSNVGRPAWGWMVLFVSVPRWSSNPRKWCTG